MKREGLALGVLLLCTACFIASGMPVDSDVYLVSRASEGIAYHNSTGLFLSSADVRINMTKEGGILVEFYSFFTIESNLSQVVTLAFILPDPWNTYPDMMDNYNISVDREQINYTIQEWDELGFVDEESAVSMTGRWILDAYFAVFQLQVDGTDPTYIEVTHTHLHGYLGHEFIYEYTFGCAKSFNGSTHQRIHMQITENNPFLNLTFFPNWQFDTWVEERVTHALWDFTVQDTAYDAVRMNGVVSEYVGGGTGPVVLPILLIVGIISLTVVVLFIGVRHFALTHFVSVILARWW